MYVTTLAPALIAASIILYSNSLSACGIFGIKSTSGHRSLHKQPFRCFFQHVSASFQLVFHGMSEVAIKVCILGRSADSIASQLYYILPDSPCQGCNVELLTFFAIDLLLHNPFEAAGKPASMTSTPNSLTALHLGLFTAVKAYARDCSPSLNVVSKNMSFFDYKYLPQFYYLLSIHDIIFLSSFPTCSN
jgi:hypothetical protein